MYLEIVLGYDERRRVDNYTVLLEIWLEGFQFNTQVYHYPTEESALETTQRTKEHFESCGYQVEIKNYI